MNNLYFLSFPEKTITDGLTCRVNGIHKPINYDVLRMDIYGIEFTDDGGFIHAEATLGGGEDFTDISVDDYVYLGYLETITPISTPVKIIRAKVTAKADNNNITTDAVYASYGGDLGFVNFDRQQWYLETSVIIGGSVSSTIENRHDANFVINVNVAPFLKIPPITMDDEFTDYPASGINNRNFYIAYQLEFKHKYKTEDEITTNLQNYNEDTIWVGLNAVRQIQEKYGNNFVNWFSDSSANIETLVNLFIAPRATFFKGFPFYYKSMIGTDQEEYLLKAYQTIDDNTTTKKTLDVDEGFVIITTIDDDLPDTKTVDIQLYWERVSDDEPFTASKEYTVDVEDRCFSYPVYLSWFASDGSQYFWLFEIRQINGENIKTNADFLPYFRDIETQNATSKDTNKTAFQTLTVGAYLPRNKFEWVKTILRSINVNMLMNIDTWQDEGETIQWQAIHPDNGSYPLDATDDTIIDFSFTFTLPQINIQSE